MLDVEAVRAEVPATKRVIYMNTGTSGPPPQSAVLAARTCDDHINEEGPAMPPVMKYADQQLGQTRATLTGLFNASLEEIALSQSASHGINIISSGLNWNPGDEVIVSDLEHVSGLVPWYNLQRRFGIRVVVAPTRDSNLDVDALGGLINPHTKMICISHVSYANGARLPVAKVAELADRHGVLLVVDGAQAVGCIRVDVSQLGCHAYAFPGQKWLLGPDGTGGLFVRKETQQALHVDQVGWASVATHDPAGHFALHASARRFEVATVNVPIYVGLAASVTFLGSLGWDRVEAHALRLATMFKEGLAHVRGVNLLTPMAPEESAGLVSFQLPNITPPEAVRALLDRFNILGRWIDHPPAVRLSFHVYNTDDEVAHALDAVRALVGKE